MSSRLSAEIKDSKVTAGMEWALICDGKLQPAFPETLEVGMVGICAIIHLIIGNNIKNILTNGSLQNTRV